MSSINNLTKVSTLSASDVVALFSASLGADAGATLANLLAWLQANLTASGQFTTQYAAPSATGFSVTIAPPVDGGSVYLLLSPAAGYAAGTIVLPTGEDGQEVLVSCTQSVSTLTVSGGTTNGAPTSLSANGFFRLRFDGVFSAWYRVG